ncbi:MFS transporter [Pseudomonas sp. R84]|uniref:MFS transporter n=1 Tax=Pseudomonas sp. R84 TaxID=1573712 RepID=UPI001EEC991B|nr:MFS transporter [Pseudomonas sp. R84]
MSQTSIATTKQPGLGEGSQQGEREHGLSILLILSALLAFASISTDLYLPGMPGMAADLHADGGTMELTISGYLAGFSVGQLFWGPFSDRFGRRLPVALGCLLFIAGSAGCALSTSGTTLIAWRLVQAFGACANVVLARAMVRDLYEGQRAAQKMSTLMTVMAIAPLAGPTVGGQILHLWSWHAIFWTLVLLGGATLTSLLWLPETLPPVRRVIAGTTWADWGGVAALDLRLFSIRIGHRFRAGQRDHWCAQLSP